MRVLPLFLLAGCASAPPTTIDGYLDVDLTEEQPRFFLVDAASDGSAPDALDVARCDGLSEPGAPSSGQRVWEIRDRGGLPAEVGYGRLPDGARELVIAEVLNPDAWYAAGITADGYAGPGWVVTFLPGDPDSVVPGAWCEIEAP